jgi:DNA-binding response OmpR family regulator
MRSLAGTTTHTAVAPCILVVDDDRRVVDLLNIALAAHGYRVVSAVDGEEAVRIALGKRPDLVVLDVRLPKKSGFEVCEILRQDPDDPFLPIIMVSAASEMDARLQGFARGADDYLAKPFSPKELVARIKRLLARATDAREARRRGREAEMELARTRDNVKRAQADLQREKRLREFTTGLARELHGALDVEELAGRFLLAVQAQVEVSVAALMTAERSSGPLVPVAIRGDGLDRVSDLSLAASGELMSLLMGPGARCAPPSGAVPGAGRRAGRADGARHFTLVARCAVRTVSRACCWPTTGWTATMRRGSTSTCWACCATRRGWSRQCAPPPRPADGLVETLIARAGEMGPTDDSELRVEAAALTERAARAMLMRPRLRSLLSHGVALGDWALTASGRHAIALAAAADPTGRLVDLGRLLDCGSGPEGVGCDSPQMGDAILLLRVARGYTAARRMGASPRLALTKACEAMMDDLGSCARDVLIAALGDGSAPRTAVP